MIEREGAGEALSDIHWTNYFDDTNFDFWRILVLFVFVFAC